MMHGPKSVKISQISFLRHNNCTIALTSQYIIMTSFRDRSTIYINLHKNYLVYAVYETVVLNICFFLHAMCCLYSSDKLQK